MTDRPAAAYVTGVVVAGGSGERFGRAGGKQLLNVAGVPVVTHSVRNIASALAIAGVVVVCDPAQIDRYRDAVGDAAGAVPLVFVDGGETRQRSVENGVGAALAFGTDMIAIHDGARPLVTAGLIDAACEALLGDVTLDGVVVGQPATDTLKLVDDGVIEATPDRSRYWAVQTPQVFRTHALVDALAQARDTGFTGTDDASIVERNGGRVGLVLGPRDNLKITLPEDAAIAEAIMAWRARG